MPRYLEKEGDTYIKQVHRVNFALTFLRRRDCHFRRTPEMPPRELPQEGIVTNLVHDD